MDRISPSSSEYAARTLPRREQLLIVLFAGFAVVAALGVKSLAGYILGRAPEPPLQSQAAPGTFRLTPQQMASLKTEAVVMMNFRAEQITDGKIALNAERTTPVFSPYSGRVTRVLANLGDQVARGTPLLAVAATEFVQAQNDLISAVAALSTARSQLSLAQINEQRKHALLEAKAGALQDWQQSQAELATAENNVRAAQTALAAVRNRLRILGKTEAEIAALESTQKAEPVAFVYAPISGRVTDRQVGLGQYIQSNGANPLFLIGDLSTVWLIANVREADAPLMHRDAPVEVHVLAFPGRVFKARLSYVAPSLDPNTRRLPVRAEVQNPDAVLKPEMFASFSIVTGSDVDAPAVPQEAVIYEGDTARIWVVQHDGSIASRQIRTGHIANGMVELLAGASTGERVVTSGTLFIDRAARSD